MRDTKYLEIIKAPVITEKSMADKENGKYTFKENYTTWCFKFCV